MENQNQNYDANRKAINQKLDELMAHYSSEEIYEALDGLLEEAIWNNSFEVSNEKKEQLYPAKELKRVFAPNPNQSKS